MIGSGAGGDGRTGATAAAGMTGRSCIGGAGGSMTAPGNADSRFTAAKWDSHEGSSGGASAAGAIFTSGASTGLRPRCASTRASLASSSSRTCPRGRSPVPITRPPDPPVWRVYVCRVAHPRPPPRTKAIALPRRPRCCLVLQTTVLPALYEMLARPYHPPGRMELAIGKCEHASSRTFFDRPMSIHCNAIRLVLALSVMLLVGGCATIRVTDPPRTATEQFLLTGAAESAVDQLSADALRDRIVYIDTTYLTSAWQTAPELSFMIGEFRAKLLKGGARVAPNRDKAQIVIELRSPGIGIDRP